MDKARLQEMIRMAELTHRFIEGNITKAEEQELHEWRSDNEQNRILFDEMQDEGYRENLFNEFAAGDSKAAWQLITGRINEEHYKKQRTRTVLIRSAAIAVILIGLGIAFYYFTRPDGIKDNNGLAIEQKNDVPPGGNKAVLTLANGKQIVLDSNANGLLAQQGHMQVINLTAGQLAYKAGSADENADEKIQYNTLTTPKGGQYQIILPDGSKVWLNAESSLKYPTAFSGRQRIVKLTGEAYFEVAENENRPFKVELSGMEIKVLGTHFNVMAYENEKNITTTLLEGKVKVTEAGKSKLLKPGQAASFDKASQRFSVAAANTEQAIAWKNGYFDFRDATLKTVMRQLSRWYDVAVQYQGDIPVRRFTGQAPRNLNLSDVLKILATSGVHFSIENRQIIVKP